MPICISPAHRGVSVQVCGFHRFHYGTLAKVLSVAAVLCDSEEEARKARRIGRGHSLRWTDVCRYSGR